MPKAPPRLLDAAWSARSGPPREPPDRADRGGGQCGSDGHQAGRGAPQRVLGDAGRGGPLAGRHLQPDLPARLDRTRLAQPTPEQPFGYGRMRFLWTFMAAIATFIAGAVFAIGYGTYELFQGEKSTGYGIAYATLAIALVAEGISWLRANRQHAPRRGRGEPVGRRPTRREPRPQRQDGSVRGHRGAGRPGHRVRRDRRPTDSSPARRCSIRSVDRGRVALDRRLLDGA